MKDLTLSLLINEFLVICLCPTHYLVCPPSLSMWAGFGRCDTEGTVPTESGPFTYYSFCKSLLRFLIVIGSKKNTKSLNGQGDRTVHCISTGYPRPNKCPWV